MPVKLADLLEDTAAVTVKAGRTEVHLTYRVFYEAALPTREENQTNYDFLAEQLHRVVLDWDLVDGDGERIPITPEAIKAADVPFKFLVWCTEAIADAQERGKGPSRS